MTALVHIDTETTSTRPDRRVWEIAMRRKPALGTEQVLTLQIIDVDLTDADVRSLNVGRFYQRHYHYRTDHQPTTSDNTRYVTEAEAARIVEQWTRDAYIVALVPSFDAEALAGILRRHKLVAAWKYYLIDIANVASGWLHGRGQSSVQALDPVLGEQDRDKPIWRIKAEKLSRACGVEPPSDEERHTAMGDARWVERWWDRIWEQADDTMQHAGIEVVTLCGSRRFYDQMMQVAAEEEQAGRIVLAPFRGLAPADQQHAVDLKSLHRAKIDRSHRIIVVTDTSRYIGESTTAAIDYAIAQGKYRPDRDFQVIAAIAPTTAELIAEGASQ